MFTDYLRISINNLLQRKTRSFLTIIGIVIGIMAVVALISIGQGLQESITGQFEKIGSDRIIIQGGIMSYGSPGLGSDKLTQDDFEVIRDVLGVKTAAPVSFKIVEIEYKENRGITMISAMHEDYVEEMFLGMDLYEIEKGDMPKKGNRGNICIGSRLASGEFWGEDGPKMIIRSKITLGETNFEKEFRINCIMKETGSPDDDSAIYMLMEDFKEIFNEPADEYGVIFAKTKEGFDVDKVAEEIEEELKDARGDENFQVATLEQVIESFGSILGILNMFLVGIAAISLLVGGIGIMNTIYTSVLERTREIGIMKSIGAKNNDILLIFLIEAGTLGLIGGIIGCGIGILLGKAVELAAHESGFTLFNALISPGLILGALMFSIAVGVVSGMLPARQASRLKPVDALRFD
ncbi:hypothetical protein BEH94_01985 [Candidatus Altiarchaeales archaeon WOR_SM1_SCG]|nr:hypothetical protein BEH94_01985 [Candidatus Altiarchaeales archaeon WOR_SM1_SCG]